MKQRKNPNLTKLFKGFRVQKRKPMRLDMKYLEKQDTLSDLQNNIVDYYLTQCSEKSDPTFIARLIALKEKPVYKAKVNHLGNPVEEKVEENKKEQEIAKE